MLTSQDLQSIRQIVKEEVRQEIVNNNNVLEARWDIRFQELEKRLAEKIEHMRTQIILEVGEFITTSVLPLIDKKADKKHTHTTLAAD